MNRMISARVQGEYIKLSSNTAGVEGAHNAVSIEISFDSMWSDTSRKVYFISADGTQSACTVLTTNLLKAGETDTYIITIPAAGLASAGEMTLTVKGWHIAAGATEADRVVMAASAFMTVLRADTPSADIAPTDVTPTQAEQLQGEIDGIKADIVAASAAAGCADAAAASASSAAGSATSAQGSAQTATTKATDATNAAASAQSAQTAAETARTAADTAKADAVAAKTAAETAAANAAAAKTAAETAQSAAETANTTAQTAKTGAESARDTAVTARDAATAAKSAAESTQAAAETAQTNAINAKTAAETAATNASNAQTAAQTARDAAVTAKADAVNAKTAAQSAQTAAETANTAATTAKNDAVTAKSAAESAKTAAQNSASAAAASATAAQTAQAAAESAKSAAEGRALDAEAWAGGTRNGVAVGTTDPAYQNNAKWYKDQAASIVGGDYPTKAEAQGYANTAEANAKAASDPAGTAVGAVSGHNTASDAHSTLFNNKVDKVSGKGLSTNDYDATEKGKVTNALPKTGDGSNVTAAFTAATTRANITTGEKLSVIMGKVAKWLSDLGTAAFSAATDFAAAVHTHTKSQITDFPASLKNPTALAFGSKTYDGSAAQTVTAGDLGALTSHQDISGKQALITATGILKGAGSGSVGTAARGTDYSLVNAQVIVSVPYTGWVQNSTTSAYEQSVAVAGLLTTDDKRTRVEIVGTTDIAAQALIDTAAGNLSYVACNTNGYLYLRCDKAAPATTFSVAVVIAR